MKPFNTKPPHPTLTGDPILPVTHAGMVQPLYERAPEAVPGPFYVQPDQCIICGLPPETAPNNIQFLPNLADSRCPHYCYVHKQPETIEELQHMVEAVCYSCVSAIRYCGADPCILRCLSEAGYPDLCDALSNTKTQKG